MNDPELIVLVVDGKTKQVCCAIIQAVMGCGGHSELISHFDDWQVNLNPEDVRLVAATRAQWESLAVNLNQRKSKV